MAGVWHTLELDLISCFVHRVKEKVAGCWVRLTCPEQSLPEQEFLECFLGTRCCERQPVWGCLMSCPRRPSGGAVGTQGWGRGLIPPFQAYPGHHLKRAEVSTVVSVVHSWQVPEMFNASNKVQGTSQSWLEWWEEVSLGIGVGGHTPGWTLPPSFPPKVSFAQDFLHSPQGSYNYHRIQESSGLVTASKLSCISPPTPPRLGISDSLSSGSVFKSSLSFVPK